MFLAHERDVTERYFFFSQVSNGAAKMNSYLNITVYSLISWSNTKYENKINTHKHTQISKKKKKKDGQHFD